MFSVLTCVTEAHDLRLVIVAALICAISSLTAFRFHLQSLRARQDLRWTWLALSGLVAGSGVWATHFIAMLAYQPSLRISYEILGTAASLLFAVLGMAGAFALPNLQVGRRGLLLGGAMAGLAIAGMHYLGIAAVRAQAQILVDGRYASASVAIGVLGGMAAFSAREALPGWKGWAAGAGLFMVTVCGLHFTSMTGIQLLPDPAREIPAEVVGRNVLAVATSALASLIFATAFALGWMERSGQRSTLLNLRQALDAVPAGLAFFDAQDRLIAWNDTISALMAECGLQVSEGLPRIELRRAGLNAGWLTGLDGEGAAALSDLETWRKRSTDLHLPDGRWIRHETFPTRNGGGVTKLTDITQQRMATEAMAAARDDAQAASRAKSAFLANMSHEIRTPLNGVLGIADVLLTTDLSAKQQEMVAVLQSSGTLLNALLTDLLDLARAEAGMAALRPEPTDLAALVRAVRDLFAARAEQKGLRLFAEIDLDGQDWVTCDPLRLRQVIGNLVNNAIKFTEAGHVVIAVRRDGDRVGFEVRDSGSGFDESLKATLFGRFQQADDTSTRRHGGAGLGLTISQEYVSLMGGALDCVSAVGVGSNFGFALELPAITSPAGRVGEDATPGRFRVLIVDDNATNRQVLGMILDSVGIDHAEVDDGSAALDAVMTCGFDAALMDIQMPVMDGLESTRRIRAWEADGGRARMPIYMVSANCLQEHVDAGVAAGADGHVSKPVSVAQLIGVLQPHAMAAALAA